jgi:hypothetical protein
MKGLITDLSLGGLYFKAATAIVPIGAEVSVTFQPQHETSAACLTLVGRVVHQSLRGFGIVFDDDMPGTCRCVLGELLLERQPVAEQPRPLQSAV